MQFGAKENLIHMEAELEDAGPLSHVPPQLRNEVPTTSVEVDLRGSPQEVDIAELEKGVAKKKGDENSALIVLNPFNLGGYGMVCCLVWCVLLVVALQRLNRKISGEHFDQRSAYALSMLSSMEIVMLLFTQASLSAKHGILTLALLRTEDRCCGFITEVTWRIVVKVLWILNVICTMPVLLVIFGVQKLLGGSITGGRHGKLASALSIKRKSGLVRGDQIRWDPRLVTRHMWIVSYRFAICPGKRYK